MLFKQQAIKQYWMDRFKGTILLLVCQNYLGNWLTLKESFPTDGVLQIFVSKDIIRLLH